VAILGELGVALSELFTCCGDAGLFCGVGAEARFERGAGVVDVVVVEELGEPAVDGGGEGVFSDVDGLGVFVRGDGVLGGELASVVRTLVVP
jgi:hypothetical protein